MNGWDDTPRYCREFADRIKAGEEPEQGFLEAIEYQLRRAAEQLDYARSVVEQGPLPHDMSRVEMPGQLAKDIAKGEGKNIDRFEEVYRWCYFHRYDCFPETD